MFVFSPARVSRRHAQSAADARLTILDFGLQIRTVKRPGALDFPNKIRVARAVLAWGQPFMTAHPRVIVASPDPIECGVVCEWLREEHFEPIRRSDPRTACEEMQNRPFDLLIADELFVFRHQLHQLSRARKPNMPTVVIGDGASADARESRSRQVMYLTRPLDRSLFVCTVALAIADGRPVRCSVRKPVERVNAIVNGVSSHIIDVSNEGLRLEIPRERGAVPLPYFNVLVPLIGVAVTFQRMWMRPASADQTDAWWCGGALVRNQARSEQAWRSVVETISVPGGTRSASPRVL